MKYQSLINIIYLWLHIYIYIYIYIYGDFSLFLPPSLLVIETFQNHFISEFLILILLFLLILWCCLNGNHPEEPLAKFGDIQIMKVENLKHLSYCKQLWDFFTNFKFQKFQRKEIWDKRKIQKEFTKWWKWNILCKILPFCEKKFQNGIFCHEFLVFLISKKSTQFPRIWKGV
jgi:hypothetical protein